MTTTPVLILPIIPPFIEKSKADTPLTRNRTFILYYHYRGSKPLELFFENDGDIKAAIERGKIHCQVMGYRFIKVRYVIADLDERERRRNDEFYLSQNE